MNCCVIVLRESCSRISIWRIHQPEDKTPKIQTTKTTANHGISMDFRFSRFNRGFSRYNLEDLLALPAPAATTELEAATDIGIRWYLRVYRWHLPEIWDIWVCVMRDVQAADTVGTTVRPCSAADVHQPICLSYTYIASTVTCHRSRWLPNSRRMSRSTAHWWLHPWTPSQRQFFASV